LAISAFGDEGFNHFALTFLSQPEIVNLGIYVYEHLVQMPLPLLPGAKAVNSIPADLGSEHRTEPISPAPNRLMTIVVASLMPNVFDVSR
jgi:hypothetical protein